MTDESFVIAFYTAPRIFTVNMNSLSGLAPRSLSKILTNKIMIKNGYQLPNRQIYGNKNAAILGRHHYL